MKKIYNFEMENVVDFSMRMDLLKKELDAILLEYGFSAIYSRLQDDPDVEFEARDDLYDACLDALSSAMAIVPFPDEILAELEGTRYQWILDYTGIDADRIWDIFMEMPDVRWDGDSL